MRGLPSSLYTFPDKIVGAWLGVVIPLFTEKISPNLTGYPFDISIELALLSLASYYCSTPLFAVYRLNPWTQVCTYYRRSAALCYILRMALHKMREKAQELRHDGVSINEIVRRLGAKKSTVSYWCRNIRLTSKQVQLLAKKKTIGGQIGILRAAEKKRRLRILATINEMRRGSADVGRLTKRDLFMLGVALYWGEGYKKGNEECGFTNSDPYIIQLFIRWMEQIYGIERVDFILRLSINAAHKTRAQEIQRFWSKITKIPESQFTKSSLVFASQKQINRDSSTYIGTLRIKVRRGTALRRRILGSISEIQKQFTG